MTSEASAFSREPLAVTVAGTRFLLPYHPAAVWVQGLDRLTVLAAVLAHAPARDALADLALSAPARVREDLKQESLRILGEAGGRKWWEVASLLKTSAAPEVLGRLVLAGVDPWARSVGEWTAATYALCVKGLDEKARVRLDFSLSLPPPGFEDEWDDDEHDPDAAMAAVQAMMGKR